MPEFWYSANGLVVVVVHAWIVDQSFEVEDMALAVMVKWERETVTPMVMSRSFLTEHFEKDKEEPWFFPVDYNRWLSNVAL